MKNIKKHIPFLNSILLVVILLFAIFKKDKKPAIIIPNIEYIEGQNTHTKEVVNNLKEEVKIIKNSEKYKDLKHILDSLVLIKDTSSLAINTCISVVKTQDTIILKQKDIITNQDFIIKNDSVIKEQYKEIINVKNNDISELEKKTKTNLWKGRIQGGVVGFISGYILSKKY